MKKISLPTETHDAIVAVYDGIFSVVANAAQMNEQIASTYYGEQAGKPIDR